MRWIIYAALFAMIGGILKSAGITIEDWQFYAVIICASTACAVSEASK